MFAPDPADRGGRQLDDSLTFWRHAILYTDNTNADAETRAQWVAVAREFKVPIRCVYFTASPTLCRHNNAVRAANLSLVRCTSG